jgi:hypothetical protein
MCEPRARHAIKVDVDKERDFSKIYEDVTDVEVDV